MRNVTIANLEMACWIARLGSFTAAADRLNTTQPAISARVRDLEEALGLQLFQRHTRGVELTIEGREFVRNAEPLLRQLEELAFNTSKSAASGVVRVGTSSICLDLVADLVREMRRDLPNVLYHVDMDRAANLLDRVESRKLDVAIVSGPIDPYTYEAQSLGVDEMLWVTSPKMLAQHEGDTLETLFASSPVWCISHASFYWSIATEFMASRGVHLDQVNEFSNTMGISRIISSGGGVGLLARSGVDVELKSGALVVVPDLPPVSDIEFFVVCRKDRADNSIIARVMNGCVAQSKLKAVALVA